MAQRQTVEVPYRPNPKQQQFHGLSAKYRGFCGGWGNGKTSAGCAEFFVRLMEFPGTNSIVARKTRPELKSTTWDMLVNGDPGPGTGGYVPWHGIPKEAIRVHNRSDLYIELWNGSKIHGLPLDDPKKLENYNLGLFMIDQAEEVEEDIFLKFRGRLRQHHGPREGLLLFNPNGHNWLWKWFIDEARAPARYNACKAIEATPFDNPNLPEDYLDQFESLPKHWYDRFVAGSHDVFVGQIFTDWNPDVHVIDPFHVPWDWERWMCIDPGIGNNGAVVWIARDFENNKYLYRELVETGQPVDWWSERVTDMELLADWGGPEEDIELRLIGPEARQRAQTDGRTVLEIWEEEGFALEVADKDPIARINRITAALRAKPGHLRPLGDMDEPQDGAGEGSPSFFVFRDAEYTVEHLPQYRWRPQRTNFTEEDPAEKPRKKDDHTIDCIGHILVGMGDSVPELPTYREVRDPEQRFADEHFERELAVATKRQAARGYGPTPLTSGGVR